MGRYLSAVLAGLVVAVMAQGQAESGKITMTILDKGTGKPVPCRIHLKDAAGKAVKAPGLPFFHDHFVCPGAVELSLPAGAYSYEIERGPEVARAAGKFSIKAGETAALDVTLERLVDLTAEGWWPGDLHIHRPPEDIELLMRAEDLHIAPVITWWNQRNHWKGVGSLPERLLVRFDDNRYYHVMAGEDEREGGALLYFNLPGPLPITEATREFPSPMRFLGEARKQKNVWIDIEKPFWWDVPVWLASGQVDSIGIANNHMCREQIYPRGEAWGRPRDSERLPPPHGNGLWSQEIYYHLLNCGLRLPPSAGSASGVLPNPVGYNRVYVHTGGELTYEKWWEALRAGRCFITNGPLLRARVNDQLPGQVFTGPAGRPIELDVRATITSADPIRFIDIVKNGQVERRVPFAEWSKTGSLGKLSFQASGWFLVRIIADTDKTFRFASTGPFYVEIGDNKRPINKASAKFFVDWVEERMQRIKLDDPGQREQVLQHHQRAQKFWRELLAKADEDKPAKPGKAVNNRYPLPYPPTLPDGKTHVSERSPDFLKPGPSLREGVAIAKTPPLVDFLYYPAQDYPGNPWSHRSDGIVVGDKYYSSSNDHLAPRGTALLWEYDAPTRKFRQLCNTSKFLESVNAFSADMNYRPGEMQSRIDLGSDGWLYYATDRGSPTVTDDAHGYKGEWVLRTNPQTLETQIVYTHPIEKHTIPASVLDPKRMIFYGGTAPGKNAPNQKVQFFALDVKKRKILKVADDGPTRTLIFSPSTGKVFWEGKVYDPDTNTIAPANVPHVRSATPETPQGIVYGTSGTKADLWAFNVKTGELKQLGTAAVAKQEYIASIEVDPKGRYLYYVPGAHGGAVGDGTPVVQLDLQTGKKKVLAFLHALFWDKYGYALDGSFGSALDEKGERLFISWDGWRKGQPRGWESCAITVLYIPEAERTGP